LTSAGHLAKFGFVRVLRPPIGLFLLLTVWIAVAFLSLDAFADYVVLKSGGRIEGEIIDENQLSVTIKAEGLGEIRFDRKDVERIEYAAIRRLPTDTPIPPTATPIPSPTRSPRFTPQPILAPPEPEPPRAEPEEPPTEPEDRGFGEGVPPEDLEDLAEFFEQFGEEPEGQGFTWDPREFDEEAFAKKMEMAAKGATVIIALVFLLFYAYLSLCRHVIAVKCETPNAWWAWIPVLRDVLLLRVGGNPPWWVFFLYLGLGIQYVMSFVVDINPFEYNSFSARFAVAIVEIIGYLLWGCFSYMMWKDVCTARGKAKNTAYLMHMHVIFYPAMFSCLGCCFFPFVLAGLLCYYLICPPFIAFYDK